MSSNSNEFPDLVCAFIQEQKLIQIDLIHE